MLYTRKGDDGTTGTFGTKERMSKGSPLAEALGTMDEVNSFLGLCKVEAERMNFRVEGYKVANIVQAIQNNLFIIQAELAGAEKTIEENKLKSLEKLIDIIEKKMPPIKSFFISGGSELAARFDVARTLARRAERRVKGVVESGEREVGEFSRSYLNRLSSILYALARYANYKVGKKEIPPTY